MERILITGAEGMLAQHFTALYADKYDIRLLSALPSAENEFYWDPMLDEIDPDALEEVDHILHLAGSGLMPTNRSVRARNVLQTYRASALALIGRMLMSRRQKVKSVITASSCLYYGVKYSPYIYTEHSKAGSDYYARLDQAAEEESYILEVERLADRSAYLRFGNILYHYGGLLPHIAIGSKFGLAVAHGLGRQVIPWVHINDACRALAYTIEDKSMEGPYNCVAPEWVTYREMAENCAKVRSNRVIPIHLPTSLLRMKYGENASHFLRSRRVSMKRLLSSGFDFDYPDFISAVLNIYDIY